MGVAYGGRGGVIAACEAPSEEDFMAHLRAHLEYYLATAGADWLTEVSYAGSNDVPNCPEGAIKLPIDTWVCKTAQQTCPIQAQVSLDDPQSFFAGCLLDQERKQNIFKAASQEDYRGFHHIPGRYLCPRCEEVRGNESGYSYHYPWELSSLTTLTPFDPDRDMRAALPKLSRAKICKTAVLNALCARHSVELATLLYPEVAANLRIIEFEIRRPTG